VLSCLERLNKVEPGSHEEAGAVLPMQIISARTTSLLVALTVAGDVTSAAAVPLNPFRYEAQAQRHCPNDDVVWLDFSRGVYYLKRQKRYGRGASGSYVCREEARASRYRRSLFGVR
jgi:hypothetical protein